MRLGFRTIRFLFASILLRLALPAVAADATLALKVADAGYLDARGVSIDLYDTGFSPMFFDQKDSGMQIVLHGHRIATNGSLRLEPTPEQWDAIPTIQSHRADKQHNQLVADLAYPQYHLSYHVTVAAEPGGVRVSVDLDQPLPAGLVGRAGYNLEFLPSTYADKAYAVDDTHFGAMPRYPEDRMTTDPPRPGDPKQLWYIDQWHQSEGYTEPRPFASGHSIVLAADDPLDRIGVSSESGPVQLFDGRDKAQNGWFVLRTLIPAGKTKDAVVWHIRPNYLPDWTRPTVIAHSQAGYAPGLPKVAILEIDPNFHAPATARLLRLAADGSFQTVFEGPISAPKPWLRSVYSKFDFSSVNRPGLYAIEYAGQRSDVFPIARDVYDQTWQASLDGFLAIQMDHVAVRDGYHVWHGVAHLDDARQAPPNTPHFDGYRMGPQTDSPYKPGEHIPGLNVGGWFDAGDYDNDDYGQYLTIQHLALAYNTFHMKWDELTVDEKARSVVMHRPDGVPDAVQQIEHGVLQQLAQIQAVGHPFMGIQSAWLPEYTFVGDAASQTDNLLYDPKLAPNERKGGFSGNPDDRWAWTNYTAFNQYGAAASLAEASVALKGWNDPLARQCLDAAVKLWNDEKTHPAPHPFGEGFARFGAIDWQAALELTIATHGAAPYKQRVEELLPKALEHMEFQGWSAVRALPYLDAGDKARLRTAVQAWLPQLQSELNATPFGVPPSRRDWGNSEQVADFGVAMYFLHEAFPDLVGPEYTLRAANYLLGTHPVSTESYIAAVGVVSRQHTYSNNRGDNSYLPGAMVPGYVVLKPDFADSIPEFGMLWFEDETTVSAASSWVLEANAAAALVQEETAAEKAAAQQKPSR